MAVTTPTIESHDMTDRTPPQYLRTLAEFAAATPLGRIAEAARERARWVIADSIPVIAAGMQQPEMQAYAARHLTDAAAGPAWVIGTGKRAGALDAALLNGTAGTWLELDEGNLFAKGHPGIQVVPAALALAQASACSGANLLRAVALGYEVSARISRAAQMRLTFHPHGTYGVIGAAVAAGVLKGFNTRQMLELLNCAATMGMAASRQTLLDGATVRNIFTGHSGYMGLTAARLVECGFTGEIDGVGNVYGKGLYSDQFDPQLAVADLGSEWLITQSYFKLHPIGRYAHSAIDALEDLLTRVPNGRMTPDALDNIVRIDVAAYKLAASLSGKNIVSSFGARFSVPFALASILYHGRSGLASFDDAAVANGAVQSLVQRVHMREEASFTARYPREQPVTVHMTMKDGTVHEGRCTVTKGEPANPHTAAELAGKFFELGEAIWGKPLTQQLYQRLLRMEDIADWRAPAAEMLL